MSRLPAPLFHAPAHRAQPRRSSQQEGPKRFVRANGASEPTEHDARPAANRAWLVFLIGVIAGAAVLAMQVNEFLYG